MPNRLNGVQGSIFVKFLSGWSIEKIANWHKIEICQTKAYIRDAANKLVEATRK